MKRYTVTVRHYGGSARTLEATRKSGFVRVEWPLHGQLYFHTRTGRARSFKYRSWSLCPKDVERFAKRAPDAS